MPPPPSKCHHGLILALLFALASFPDLVLAQFFTTYQANQIQWPSGGTARYQALQDTNFSKSVTIVSSADVRTAQSNGLLSFQLPGDTSTLQVEASLISEDPTGAFIWSGTITSTPGGYLSFIYLDGKTGGFIQHGKDFYEIMPLDSNYQFLVERNNHDDALNRCEVGGEEPPPGNDCTYEPTGNTCPALITVLLIFTPEAKDIVEFLYGSTDLFALSGQASVNQAFWNSDIPNKEIRVKWVTKDGFDFDLDQNANHDLVNFATFAEPERTDNHADLVVFVPHVNYGNTFGVANLPLFGPDPDQAFSIVKIDGFISEFVFAHELGHNFGCRHNWSIDYGDDNVKVCAHGKRHFPLGFNPDPGIVHEVVSWRTIMGTSRVPGYYTVTVNDIDYIVYLLSSYAILHYSNPLISYEGEPTGRDAGKVADNADQIRKVGCAVSEYDNVSELGVNFSVTSTCSGPVTLTSFIFEPSSPLPGVAPYTVRWFWNTTGIFGPGTQQFLGMGATLTLDAHPECPVYWIKCIVVSDDNVVVSRVKKVTLPPTPCACEEEERPARGREVSRAFSEAPTFSIFPNPVAQGTLFVHSREHTSLEVTAYKITDVWGRVVSNGFPEALGETEWGLPVTGLRDGLYSLQLLLPGGTQQTNKFIVAKAH